MLMLLNNAISPFFKLALYINCRFEGCERQNLLLLIFITFYYYLLLLKHVFIFALHTNSLCSETTKSPLKC